MVSDSDFALTVPFAENMEPRCACVLLLDTSGSMSGSPIRQLNDGIQLLKTELIKDGLAARRVEISVVAFSSGVQVLNEFSTVESFSPPHLTAGGATHTGAAVLRALDLVAERKALYKSVGVSYYRPWVFLITDGEPSGEASGLYETACERVTKAEADKAVAFFSIGVQGANMAKLAKLGPRAPLPLQGLNFDKLFQWLSVSLTAVSRSRTDEQVALPAPTGWAQI